MKSILAKVMSELSDDEAQVVWRALGRHVESTGDAAAGAVLVKMDEAVGFAARTKGASGTEGLVETLQAIRADIGRLLRKPPPDPTEAWFQAILWQRGAIRALAPLLPARRCGACGGTALDAEDWGHPVGANPCSDPLGHWSAWA